MSFQPITNYANETGGSLATVAAAQGANGTGITQPTGGSGILGWLSGIYNRLAGVVLAAGSAIIGKVGIDQTTPGTTNGVQDASDGPVAAGAAAGKSSLAAGVFNTAAPALTNGQQVATQLDASGNARVNPTGSVGSFATTTVTAPGNGGTVQLTLTVPAGTKWQLQAFSLLVQAANASTPRIVSANITDAAGKFPVSIAAGVNAPINANTFFTFGPGLPLSTAITSTNASVPVPQVPMGPAFTINIFIQNTNAGDTLTATASYISYPN
jgi:hypothetical protein